MKWRSSEADAKRYTNAYYDCRREWHKRYALVPRLIDERVTGGILIPGHKVWLEYVARRRSDDRWEYKPYNDEPTLRELMDKNIQDQIDRKVRYEDTASTMGLTSGPACTSSAYMTLPSGLPPGQIVHFSCDQTPNHSHTIVFS